MPTFAAVLFLLATSVVVALLGPGSPAGRVIMLIGLSLMVAIQGLGALPVQRMVLYAVPREPLKIDGVAVRYVLIGAFLFALRMLLDPYSGIFFQPGRDEALRIAGLVMAMAGLAYSVLSVRLALMFPAIITGQPKVLVPTLALTRGSWWRLWWVQTLGLAPPALAIVLLSGGMTVAAREGGLTQIAVFTGVIPALAALTVALFGMSAAVNAFAYKALVGVAVSAPIEPDPAQIAAAQ